MNPGKFQAIIFDKQTGNHTNQIKKIDQKEVKAASKVKVLGMQLDDKLNFNCQLNLDSLHARLIDRYEAWSYKKKKYRKIKA